MKTLLITGASGFLGWYLGEAAAPHWQVYGTYRSHARLHPGITGAALDITNFQAVKALFEAIRPDAVIHLAAQSKPNLCEADPTASYAVNVTASINLAGLCADGQIPLVFTSSDMVFDGKTPPYRETDPVSPINRYGEQKVAAEEGMGDRYPLTAICRMPLMFGAAPTAPSFLQPFLEALRSGRELRLFTDEIRTPVSGRVAANGLLMAIAQVQGLLHLGGAEGISRFGFGQLMAEVFGLPSDLLHPCRQADVPMAAPRPADVSLDSSRAFQLGYQPGLTRDELMRIRALEEPE